MKAITHPVRKQRKRECAHTRRAAGSEKACAHTNRTLESEEACAHARKTGKAGGGGRGVKACTYALSEEGKQKSMRAYTERGHSREIMRAYKQKRGGEREGMRACMQKKGWGRRGGAGWGGDEKACSQTV